MSLSRDFSRTDSLFSCLRPTLVFINQTFSSQILKCETEIITEIVLPQMHYMLHRNSNRFSTKSIK